MQGPIDELENAVNNATRLPVGGKLLMDETLMRRLIAELRSAAPTQEQVWQQIVAQRDQVLAEAEEQARHIRENAQFGDVDEQAVVQAGRQRAREIISEGERQAAHLRDEADVYVLNQFNALEQRLMRVLREVQAGQRALGRGGES